MSTPTRYLVTFKDDVTTDQIAAFRSGLGKNVLGTSNANVKEINTRLVKGFSAALTDGELNEFKSFGDSSPIASIEVDSVVTTQ
ncbi:hypothetical protein FIBSPDRAFT_942615 [Athelia psychrophila]|uniref:Inhibitor I9 domain-containing protein n=1 Tax=Athelia psychrophila TaxID=1759441 RepID=A0A166X788_9AGAM|nr:hypothetical protein FIBSPDRAFT_942615 [Fibularhizoctonia sp. CBS 109695]